MSLTQVSKVIVGSPQSTVILTGINDDSDYLLTVNNVFLSSATDVKMRFTEGGSGDSSSNYFTRYYVAYHDSSNGSSITSSSNNIDLSQAIGTTYNNGLAMMCYLYGFQGSRHSTAVFRNSHRNLSLGRFSSIKGGAMLNETGAKDGVYFYCGGGSANFSSGTFVLYRINS